MSLKISTYVQIRGGQSYLNGENFLAVEGEEFLKEFYKQLQIDYSKFYKMDDLCKVGMVATEILISKRPDLLQKEDDAIAMVFQSENGCLQTDADHQADVDAEKASPAVFVYTLSNIVCGEISIRFKWFGESIFFINDSKDTKNLLTYSKSLILSGKAECCLVGRLEVFGGDISADLVLIENSNEGHELEDLQSILDSK